MLAALIGKKIRAKTSSAAQDEHVLENQAFSIDLAIYMHHYLQMDKIDLKKV